MLSPTLPGDSPTAYPHCFLANTFGYTTLSPTALTYLISTTNNNLAATKKEVLLWHFHLYHTATTWIQVLMRSWAWLPTYQTSNPEQCNGPFSQAPNTAHHAIYPPSNATHASTLKHIAGLPKTTSFSTYLMPTKYNPCQSRTDQKMSCNEPSKKPTCTSTAKSTNHYCIKWTMKHCVTLRSKGRTPNSNTPLLTCTIQTQLNRKYKCGKSLHSWHGWTPHILLPCKLW
jgi:hypothetical protein